MKTYRIYTLNHPMTNEVRYVGQTCQSLISRLNKHLYRLTKSDKSHKVNWIKSLLKEGLEPKIVLIIDGLTKEECNRLEKEYIKKYRESGISLTNMTDGGEGSFGFKHSEDTIKLLTELRNKNNTKEHRELLSKSAKKQWENSSDEYKLNNQMNQPNRRNILQCDLDGNIIREFVSLREIERELGYFRANITPHMKGKFKHAYGFIWKYSH